MHQVRPPWIRPCIYIANKGDHINILHLFYRHLYWTDWNLSPYIGRIGMNGDNATRIITKKIGWPNALAIDYETNRLWWGDAHLDFIE